MRIPLICHCAAIGIGCLVINTLSTPATASAPDLPQPPNVLLLVADDLGYAELGCQGNDSIKTPKIDAFSQSAVRCTQAYVTAPNCSPSRAGFLTGRIPLRFGYEFNPIGARNEDPPDRPSHQATNHG